MLLCVNRFRYYYYYYYCKRKVVMMMMMMNDSILLYTYRIYIYIYIYVEYPSLFRSRMRNVHQVVCCTCESISSCVTEPTTLTSSKRSNDDIIVTCNIVSNTIEVRSNHLVVENPLATKKDFFFDHPYLHRAPDRYIEHRKETNLSTTIYICLFMWIKTKHQPILEERH